MKQKHIMSNILSGAAGAMVAMAITTVATATEPCGDLGECKALIEINATDGDIGFHFLMDGDDLIKSEVRNPDGQKIFEAIAKKEEREQFMTETFVESAEPFCRDSLKEDEDDEVVTLEEFLERWPAGTYEFIGKGEEGEMVSGETELLHDIPAAPDLTTGMLGFDGSVISWAAGNDLGECATEEDLDDLFTDGVLPIHPKNVTVVAWEAVFEPDVEAEDGATPEEIAAADALSKLKFTVRVPLSQTSVTVPADYLSSLPPNTPAKIEVGALGVSDNATFTEIFDICVNEVSPGCD